MTANVVFHFSTSRSPDQASNAQIVHSQIGGRLMCVDTPRRACDPLVAGAVLFSPRRLEDVFASAMASAHGGVIDVVPAHAAAMIDFMKQHPGTIESMGAILISVDWEDSSLRQLTVFIDALVTAGMRDEQLRVIFSGRCLDARMETAFAHLLGRHRNAQFPNCTVEAVLSATGALESAREHQLPIALILNDMVDFEAELVHARSTGADESTLRQLARKVLAQRKLLTALAQIRILVDSLRLPRAVGRQWLDEMLHAWLLAKPALPAIAGPGNASLPDPEKREEGSNTSEA
jgi:hypothetical protein